jgi:hypothetical protein
MGKLTRRKAVKQYKNLKTLTPELAAKIHEAFGPCSAMYECNTVPEIVAAFEEMLNEKPARDLAYWIDIQLRVEDASGSSSEVIADIKQRLCEIEVTRV